MFLGAFATAGCIDVGLPISALADTDMETSQADGVADVLPEPSAICPILPLSAVGEAMNKVAGERKSSCIGLPNLPNQWLHTIYGWPDFPNFRAAVRDEFMKTTKSFSHASLYWYPQYEFDQLLAELNHNLTMANNGQVLPQERKPIIRFMYGQPSRLVQGIYDDLVKRLPTDKDNQPDPTQWSVRIAVKRANFGTTAGWNHMKLNIRDRFATIASSIEPAQFDLGIHLAGSAAGWAQNWFDTVWHTPTGGQPPVFTPPCHGSDDKVCVTDASPFPVIFSERGYSFRGANVFSLRHGYVKDGSRWGTNYEGDDALFAGMSATSKSAFFLSPGMTTGVWPYRYAYSVRLVDEIADRLADSVDVKFVWGDTVNSPRTPDTWKEIQLQILDRFNRNHRGMSLRQKQTALCKFHMADFPITPALPGSHAKFYMLDGEGFYVGSQNMYPSSIRSDYWGMPELAEFGYFVDAMPGVNMDLAQEVTERVVKPTWRGARWLPQDQAPCAALPNPVHLDAQTGSANYTCASDFILQLDFAHVDYNEVAKAFGGGYCLSGGETVGITIDGSVGTDGRFVGTIFGSIANLGVSDQAPLIGSLVGDSLKLTFSGLEPIHSVSYSGIVETR